jgi:hypothetical protein
LLSGVQRDSTLAWGRFLAWGVGVLAFWVDTDSPFGFEAVPGRRSARLD